MRRTLIIAEAGVNHNGDMEIAKRLIEAAADAGADYVKFQTFKTEKLVSEDAPAANYQKDNLQDDEVSQFEMLKKLELDLEAHLTLIDHCNKMDIKFLSTAFDLDSIELLNRLEMDVFKIPSGEITNLPYLERIGQLGKPIILSTGMSNLNEIEESINALCNAGASKDQITILHCNTQYPTPYRDVNLTAMNTIKNTFGVKVGYSDHSLGIEVPIAAVSLGAVCIEKHFTLDKSLPGPDHAASLEPEELKQMIRSIRNIEEAMGSGIKEPTASESENIPIVRKSIHITRDLSKGHKLTMGDLSVKRPGYGISPMKINELVGKVLNKDIRANTIINPSDYN